MKPFVYILIFIFFENSGKAQIIENIVFEGAGISGIAYSGAISALDDNNVMASIKRVGGTSAGAITALALSVGYNAKEIEDLIYQTNFKKFNDGKCFFLGGLHRMNKYYGWYKGNQFSKWIEGVQFQKTKIANCTFKQLREAGFKELYVTGTCLNQQKLIVFSANTYPNMRISDAVRISMSIPLYFQAVAIDAEGRVYKNSNQNPNLDLMLDGGILANFPIDMFDSIDREANQKHRLENLKTIGVRMDTDSQMSADSLEQGLAKMNILNKTDYAIAFYTLLLETINRATLTDLDWKRSISVSSKGIGPKLKKLSFAQKQLLIESGYESMNRFLKDRKE